MKSKSHASHRAPKKTSDLTHGRPGSDDDVREAFSLQPRHAARLVLPKEIRAGLSETIVRLLLACLIPILVVLIIRIFFLGQYLIPSGSMKDTLAINDRVLSTQSLTLNKGNLSRGDIVIFHDPGHWLGHEHELSQGHDDYIIKRLIGLPGDRVQCAGRGKPITINGHAVDESPYLKEGVQPSTERFDVLVPAGHIFVMGDNRANSADSRYHLDDETGGMVPINNIVGVAFCVSWPISHWKRINNHHEVFKEVPATIQNLDR